MRMDVDWWLDICEIENKITWRLQFFGLPRLVHDKNIRVDIRVSKVVMIVLRDTLLSFFASNFIFCASDNLYMSSLSCQQPLISTRNTIILLILDFGCHKLPSLGFWNFFIFIPSFINVEKIFCKHKLKNKLFYPTNIHKTLTAISCRWFLLSLTIQIRMCVWKCLKNFGHRHKVYIILDKYFSRIWTWSSIEHALSKLCLAVNDQWAKLWNHKKLLLSKFSSFLMMHLIWNIKNNWLWRRLRLHLVDLFRHEKKSHPIRSSWRLLLKISDCFD